MKNNTSIIKTIQEIQDFAFSRSKFSKELGIMFDPFEFIKNVENTRLTTHMDLSEAFEYEKSKLTVKF